MLGYAWSYSTAKDEAGDTIGVVEATYGEDGYDVGGFYAQLDVKLSDEKGIVTATLDADTDNTDNPGAYIGEEMGANVTVDVLKLFGLDTDFSLKLTGTYNDRVTGLRAYKTAYGFGNADRIRTLNGGNPLSLDFTYGKLVQARVAYVYDGSDKAGDTRDFLVSV